MTDMTLDQWASLSQIVAVIVGAIGIIASMYFSIRALREVQTDREYRHRPYLAFEGGGFRYPIQFVKAGKRIPGISPQFVEEAFPNLSPDAESVWLCELRTEDGGEDVVRIGRLKNYGIGPALEVQVTWIPLKVMIGGEEFELDAKKRSEPVYNPDWNRMPSVPRHIFPEGIGGLTRLPTFIDKDCDKKIREVRGVLDITCEDAFGKLHVTHQAFYICTNYNPGEDKPYFHVTFRSIIQPGERRRMTDG